jgi:hypothetical protein
MLPLSIRATLQLRVTSNGRSASTPRSKLVSELNLARGHLSRKIRHEHTRVVTASAMIDEGATAVEHE